MANSRGHRPHRTPQGNADQKHRICFFFRDHGRCKFGAACNFSHDMGQKSTHTNNTKATPAETALQAQYRRWKHSLRSRLDPEQKERLWDSALSILDSEDRELRHNLAQELNSDKEHGLRQIKDLVEERARPGDFATFIRARRSFLTLMTHPALLDCLSLDTHMGSLYDIMSGTKGERAVSFFQHMCKMCETAAEHRPSLPAEMLESTLVAMSNVLCELLKRDRRARFHADLPELMSSFDEVTKIVTGRVLSITQQHVTKRIEEMQAYIARANGLVSEFSDARSDDLNSRSSAYPRDIQVPCGRHDNDKIDITEMIIYPTQEEIMSNAVESLPSTDPDQPHYLVDKAQRHIDTNFRLLRHDTFGQLKMTLANLIETITSNPDALQDSKVQLEDVRAYPYIGTTIDTLTFRRHSGLQAHVSFPHPPQIGRIPASEIERWWEDSKRLRDGVLLSFIWFDGTAVRHLFMTTTRFTDRSAPAGQTNLIRKVVCTSLATHSQENVDALIDLDCSKHPGLLLEYPNIIPGTFVPVLENLQNMQRLVHLPFRQWILPERAHEAYLSIPVPLYARSQEFRFSLQSIQQPGNAAITISLTSSTEDDSLIDDMVAKTELDRGQCRAMVAALTREFAFIQGPPGTGKSYLGIKLMKVLLDTKSKAKLGPIVVVCYTNHALDQFLEHLLTSGVRKIVRIGGQSRSDLLEDHNLRKISHTITKTRVENGEIFAAYKALDNYGKTVESKLSQIHALQKRFKWEDLEEYLAGFHPDIHAQFSQQTDEDGFTRVGRHLFDIWRPNANLPHNRSVGISTADLLRKAAANVNSLSHSERCLLANHWVEDLQKQTKTELFECVENAEATKTSLTNVHEELNRRVLQDADVIGLTTTGLAKNMLTLQRIRSKVVICEEAGEVMEPHMISTMLPTVEHFIQIGDHEQLRPTINHYKDLSLETQKGQQHQLDRSQFERLSKGHHGRPSMPLVQLKTQRRMRPEISSLIRETIYPGIVDHSSTTSLPDVVGMRSNVFWLDHGYGEMKKYDVHQKSKSNAWEVAMVHALVRHVVRQGIYSRSDIAVLTPYTGQLQKLRTAMRNDFEIVLSERDEEALAKDGFTEKEKGDTVDGEEASHDAVQPQETRRKKPLMKKQLNDLLRLATVDNFQGEEAKIVIVSLVRSNDEQQVGFLRTTNRINVLLSRAQHGMYVIGNANTYSNVAMWQQVIGMLRAKDAIGTDMGLCCPRHPDTTIQIREPEDFSLLSPEGGCREPCQDRLPECGHRCQSRCHSKAMHDVWKCERPCERRHEACKHSCQKATCGEDCGRCMVILHDVQLPCGHLKNNVQCWKTQTIDQIVCDTFVDKNVPGCGHVVSVRCGLNVTAEHYRCPTRCGKHLTCGHDCTGTCGGCNTKDNEGRPVVKHPKCKKVCGKPFSACNHSCPEICHSGRGCGLCQSRCEVRCKHSQCTSKCFEPCAPCVEPCTWSCEHQGECTMPCSAPCNRLPCDQRCSKQLPCGHQCPSLCGENCPEEYCQDCGMKGEVAVDMLEFKTYGEIDLNETPVIVLNCGHFFTAETLDGNIRIQDVYEQDRRTGEISGLKDMLAQLAKKIPCCPNCRAPIRQYATQRYNRLINRAVIDEMSKQFIVTGQTDLQALEERLESLEQEMETSREALIAKLPARTLGQNEDRIAADLTKQLQSRYQLCTKLQNDILQFQNRVSKRHEPANKLHEATIYAMQQARNANLDSAFATLSLRDTIPSSERDHRITFGGRMTLLKADCTSLEDKLLLLLTLSTKRNTISTAIKFPGRPPRQLTGFFLQKCTHFITDCTAKSLPRLAVEGTLLFARIARICTTIDLTDEEERAKATSYREEAKGHLEQAEQLCKSKFRDAEVLLQAVQESLKLLQREWYEEVTAEELAAIKLAMVSGYGGLATHSGHWYRCVNGHPFAIGECGMPMEQATCPECGEGIGGRNHTAVAGVTRAREMED